MILLVLLGLFAGLSLIAIGGVASTLPAMARAVVAHHWMSAPQFAALFGLAQTSPGPNMLIATLIGLHVAGIAGALVATLGMIGPSSVLTVVVAGVWERFRAARWRLVLQAAITPVSGGLILAAALVVVRAADHGLRAWAITLAVMLVSLCVRLHPLVLLAAAAALGAALF
ncbi:MAG TPA: chromate transporter [Acidiphilium sp.]|uniref:chromate transporter n=1 Tax=unclassified Acidiphilium TaxID=2617493 RepID=UPI000BDACB49|nr:MULTISPECIES: chromate transporter [unclassified Acidiphilium]OYV57660.1 MAG: chromate transporter [Acidiphilium sp. 20-67-58]OYV83178.1 MAG: chromate transporter [Acidiphilium sp. 21-68-69]HQT62158.1 chromate transporter [Acidiphilium sp.]HQU12025.1 chromate transporter [Acidiphilium sp.]